MQLLSRVMGSHKLCILGFYSYIIKSVGRFMPSFQLCMTDSSDISPITNSKSR